MNILLDTHTFLWHLQANQRLSTKKSEIIENKENKIYLSIASLWEIAIKSSLGKLEINGSINQLVPPEISILEINTEHIEKLRKLPFHHRDPFDRLIIAQSIVEKLIILTEDGNFKFYDVAIL